MKSAIRMFALLVAIAGLAAASLAPATSRAIPTHMSITVSGPGPSTFPALCRARDGTCLVSPSHRIADFSGRAAQKTRIARKCQQRVTLLCLGSRQIGAILSASTGLPIA
jgi:hypothetical protein